ncbi:hypothetical protein C8R46DRAFT_1101729 [Mycena filopes]|nr:hypothetical protein C8R46DRAFT_1101729 [Mycena filopes]
MADTVDTLQDREDDAAASKVWAVYVSEAEKYDKSLVESWKSDMEGMLIFAGLFSASLTAFIIESYKTLTPDSCDSMVQLLAQISQQLAAAANGSTFQVPVAPTPFSPPTTSLVCNTLWFISLGLSLTCALIATLLEQWARDFLHRADMRSAPVIRARVFSYLYYGLKRFSMHTVVDIIPLLLHASLLFFFAGLVAFLLPINPVITYVAAGLLVVVVAIYSLLTVLPIWYLDCPYRTPLSAGFWRISQISPKKWSHWRHLWQHGHLMQSRRETVVGAMFREAMAPSPARAARDYRALVWTVKSLADDSELEPFVEGIPDLLWAPEGRRHSYEHHIKRLARSGDIALLSRIEGLLRSCNGGFLSADARGRREITCYKAVWAIASIQTFHIGLPFPSRGIPNHYCFPSTTPGVAPYSQSAVVLANWNYLQDSKAHLTPLVTRLLGSIRVGHPPPVDLFKTLVESGSWVLDLGFRTFMSDRLEEYVYNGADFAASDLASDIVETVKAFFIGAPYKLFFNYCIWAAAQGDLPYRFWETMEILVPSKACAAPSSTYADLEWTLAHILESIPLDDPRWNEPGTQCFDTVIQALSFLWSPQDSQCPIPTALTQYFASRKSLSVLRSHILFFNGLAARLLRALPTTLSQLSSLHSDATAVDNMMVTVWLIASHVSGVFTAEDYQPILDAIAGFSVTPTIFSTVSVVKMIFARRTVQEQESAARGPIDTACLTNGDDLTEQQDRTTEVQFMVLAEFLEGWTPSFEPYELAETIRCMVGAIRIPDQVGEECQRRLARSLTPLAGYEVTETLIESGEAGITYLRETHNRLANFDAFSALMDSDIFRAYITATTSFHPWLTDAIARDEVKLTLSRHLGRLGSTPAGPEVLRTLQVILRRLESLHSPNP